MIRRAEPVVYSSWKKGAPLGQEQTEQFERDGYLVLTDVFSVQELAALQAASERVGRQCAKEHADKVVFERDSEKIRTLFGIHAMEGLLKTTANHPRLIHTMRYLLDDEVYVHQSRLNVKNACYGSGFEWHSDFETWHAEDGMPGMRCISATLLLTDEISAGGALKFIPGSHKTFVACPGETPDQDYQDALRKQAVGKPPVLFLNLLQEMGGVQELVAPAGSVVLFDCNLMHGSGTNTCDHLRANLFYVYNAVSNALGNPYAADAPRPQCIAAR
ncbi:MAG: ectoine hydroxylase [Limnobacter sp.]|nr:ectoine hydroxylase [Limnobacter sp.]